MTRAEMEGRRQLEWVVGRLRAEVPGFERAHLVDIATQIGIRESRRILGEHLLQESELLEGVRFPDAIAQGTYPVDIHNPTGRGIVFKQLDGRRHEVLPDGSSREGLWTPDGKKRDTPCYQVPYRCLVPRGVENLPAPPPPCAPPAKWPPGTWRRRPCTALSAAWGAGSADTRVD